MGARSAGNPHAAFDERGGETDRTCGTAPLLDSTTGEGWSAARGPNGRRYSENGRADVCGEGWVAHEQHRQSGSVDGMYIDCAMSGSC